MIAKIKPKRKNRLSKTTIMTFRNLARKGTDAELEGFLHKVAMNYIAEVRDADYVDPDDYVKVTGKTFEAVCPYCSETMVLCLDELAGGE